MTKRYYRPANRNHMRNPTNNLYAYALIIAALIMLYSVSSKACDEVYLKIGAGYKFQQTEYLQTQDGARHTLDHTSPISARIEIGVQKGKLSYGLSHHSNWLSGWPVNNDTEYTKTELYVDYRFTLWGM